MKDKIRGLISKGKTERAIQYALENLPEDDEKFQQIIRISAVFNRLNDDHKIGIVSSADYQSRLNKINHDILLVFGDKIYKENIRKRGKIYKILLILVLVNIILLGTLFVLKYKHPVDQITELEDKFNIEFIRIKTSIDDENWITKNYNADATSLILDAEEALGLQIDNDLSISSSSLEEIKDYSFITDLDWNLDSFHFSDQYYCEYLSSVIGYYEYMELGGGMGPNFQGPISDMGEYDKLFSTYNAIPPSSDIPSPKIDFLIKNSNSQPQILTAIGFDVLDGRFKEPGSFGDPNSIKVKISSDYEIQMPVLETMLSPYLHISNKISEEQLNKIWEYVEESSFDEDMSLCEVLPIELKRTGAYLKVEEVLKDVVSSSIDLEDPIYLNDNTPFRFTLTIKGLSQGPLNQLIVRFWVKTDKGKFYSPKEYFDLFGVWDR